MPPLSGAKSVIVALGLSTAASQHRAQIVLTHAQGTHLKFAVSFSTYRVSFSRD
jgi:hypothetical protein